MKRNSKLAMAALSLSLSAAFMLTGCNPTSTGGTSNSGAKDAVDSIVETASFTWGTESVRGYRQEAWNRLKTYYESNKTPTQDTTVADLNYAAGTELRMAVGYNSADTGLTFKNLPDKAESITLADGNTYRVGDFKPTWQAVQAKLGFTIKDNYTGKKAAEEFAVWESKLGEIDMFSGTAAKLTEAGNKGLVVDIAKYLDVMPNFKQYLKDNPIVRLSITGSTSGESEGAIYFSPYFDGVKDIERMPLMRTDIVETLLNGEGEFTASASGTLKPAVYQAYMPTKGTVEVDIVKKDGTVGKLTKDYSKGNIIVKMNEALANGEVTGVQAVNMLRKYIDETYAGYYGTNRADLFIGQDAAWDADEMVALLRCVVANAKTINGTDTMYGLFSREDYNNQRRVDTTRFAGILFGVRGLESRSDYYYFNKAGDLVDARSEEAAYRAMEKMNALYQEGLISADYNREGAENAKTANYLKNNNGFMSYDYNQTQTLFNNDKEVVKEGQKYRAVMVPVAKWNDGNGEKYMRFTESWRSVKTDGWGISKAGVGDNTDKLKACLKLIDFAYSKEGQILMSYGPDAFIDVKNAAGTTVEEKYNTFDFNGTQWPKIASKTNEELWKLAGGNYTNYARKFLGSTLSFLKSQSFEYECTTEAGKEGAAIMSKAIKLGVIKHPELAIAENMWYTSIPTVFPTTAAENAEINKYTNLNDNGKFSSSKGKTNVFVDIITKGASGISLN